MKDAENTPACCAPFAQMLLKPNGRVTPCCYLYGYHIGDATKEPILSIWNAPKLQKLRKEFFNGSPRTCAGRMKNMGCHHDFEHLRQQIDPAIEQSAPPQRLDVRLGGLCNLKCVMCDVWQEPNHRYDQSDFWSEGPESIFPFLQELEVAGGEPFLQKDVYRLMRSVSASNPNCQWSFITNGSYPFQAKIKQHLDALSIKRIHVSIDSLEAQTYQEIRRGADLSQTLATAQAFANYRTQRKDEGRGFTLAFSMCVLTLNWTEIPAFLAYCEQHQAEPVFQFAYYDPSGHSLRTASNSVRNAVIAMLDELPDNHQSMLAPIRQPLTAPPINTG